MACTTLYGEFTANLISSSDLTYQIYLIINAYKNMKTITQRTTTPDITWFTPSVGATSTKLCFIQLATKPQFSSAHSAADPFKSFKAVHTAAGLCAHSCRFPLISYKKPSAHTAAEVVHAHSWDLTFPYKIALASP